MQSFVNVSFLGDISLNNQYEKMGNTSENPFTDISEQLFKSELVIGNLECLLYGNGVNEKKIPRIGTTDKALSLLKFLNLKMVTLAHNHIYDNLLDGFNKTTSFLKKNNIDFLGASANTHKYDDPLFMKIRGINFCFLNYVTEDTNPKIPNNAPVFLNFYNREKILNDIKNNKSKCDQLILLFHWGGRTEGYLQPDWYQRQDSHSFIDAGADLIIGGHSHTLQPFEVYKNKYIFYSLGNFCFGDVLYDGNHFKWGKESLNSVIVSANFSKSTYTIDLIPISNSENHVVNDKSSSRILYKRNRMFKIIFYSIYIWKVYFFYERFPKKAFLRVKSKILAKF